MNLNREIVEQIVRLALVLFGIGATVAFLSYVVYHWLKSKLSRF